MNNWGFGETGKFQLSAEYNAKTNYYDVVFTVDPEMANTIKNNYFKANKNRYQLKGFRKNKVTRQVIERMMGGVKAIYSIAFGTYATDKILEHSPHKVIHLTNQESDETENGGWKLSCSVLTDHPVDDFDKLLEMPEFKLEKMDPNAYVDYRIETFKKLNPYLHKKDGPVEEGNMVEVAIHSTLDGKVFKPGCENSTNIRVVKGAVQPPSLYEKLLGAKEGDSFIIETGNVNELAGRFGAKVEGKKFELEVKINHVYTCEEAEVDNDLAISAGFSSLEEWVNNLVDTSKRINDGRDKQVKRQFVLDHISANSKHPELPFEWGIEKAVEANPGSAQSGVNAEHVKNICKVSRQLIILRLIGEHLGLKHDDEEKNKYERDDNAYAEKVLQHIVTEKARFVYDNTDHNAVGGGDKADSQHSQGQSQPVGT